MEVFTNKDRTREIILENKARLIILDESEIWRDVVSDIFRTTFEPIFIWEFDTIRSLLIDNEALDRASHFVCEAHIILSEPRLDAWYEDLCQRYSWLADGKDRYTVGDLVKNVILPRGILPVVYTTDDREIPWATELNVPVVKKTIGDDTSEIKKAFAQARLTQLRKRY